MMTDKKTAIILMTALLPTTGHTDLIEFAQNIPNTDAYVLINGRSFEPLSGETRLRSIKEFFHHSINIKLSMNDAAPQNPEDMKNGFWEWWKNEINTNFPNVKNWDYVVASEIYGKKVAESLDAQFIPYDIERLNNNTKSTNVRKDLWNEWNKILPAIRQELAIKAVMFGQESVGKTTLSKKVSETLNSRMLVEWARPYLETVGEELSLQKMSNIHHGQASLQHMFFKKAETPSIVLDTDLFSSIGYYRIMNEKEPDELVNDAMKLSSDIYYILPDTIPFVEDILRYGGNERESTMNFWIELLEEFEQNYVIVPDGSVEEKTLWITDDIRQRFGLKTKDLVIFNRE